MLNPDIINYVSSIVSISSSVLDIVVVVIMLWPKRVKPNR